VLKNTPPRGPKTPDRDSATQTPIKRTGHDLDDIEDAAESASTTDYESTTGSTTVTDSLDTSLDNFIEKVAVRVEKRIMREVDWRAGQESKRMESWIRITERKINKLKKDVQKLKDRSRSAEQSPQNDGL
jgi:hypothetical protein